MRSITGTNGTKFKSEMTKKLAKKINSTMTPSVEHPDVVVHMSRFQQQPKDRTLNQ